jgi:hypothetical protein
MTYQEKLDKRVLACINCEESAKERCLFLTCYFYEDKPALCHEITFCGNWERELNEESKIVTLTWWRKWWEGSKHG